MYTRFASLRVGPVSCVPGKAPYIVGLVGTVRYKLVSALALILLLFAGAANAAADYRVSGPYVHRNLAVYLVHGKSAAGPVPLTLQEAIAKGSVVVHETGNVRRLSIENRGGEEVFVQFGDIVKGGRQDRVLAVSLLLPPRSGRIPIGAYCVEQGRWAARGRESVSHFASARSAVPSRRVKLALRAPPAAKVARHRQLALGRRTHPARDRVQAFPLRQTRSSRQPTAQSEVWAGVAKAQSKLSKSLSTRVASAKSRTSLQLALENKKLAAARAAYVGKLVGLPAGKPDVIGFAFAINGKINSADVYTNSGLFKKLWPKLLSASATEAISERSAKAVTAPPKADAVKAFLTAAQSGTSRKHDLAKAGALEIRDGKRAVFAETKPKARAWVHRNYLAK